MSKNIIANVLSHENNYEAGMGKIVPEDIQGKPNKIAQLLGASQQTEKKSVYFKNEDGSFSKVSGQTVIIKPTSVFAAIQKEIANHGLTISYGTASKGTVTLCAQLPPDFDYNVGPNDSIRSFIVIRSDDKGRIKANKATLRQASGATLQTNDEDYSISSLMEVMPKLIKEEAQTFKSLAGCVMSTKDLMKYFCAVIDVRLQDIGMMDREGTKIISTKTENILKGISESYASAPGSSLAKGNLWGALCAVTYYCTHLKTVRDTTGKGEDLARALSNLLGDAGSLKLHALELAIEHMEKKKVKEKKVA